MRSNHIVGGHLDCGDSLICAQYLCRDAVNVIGKKMPGDKKELDTGRYQTSQRDTAKNA